MLPTLLQRWGQEVGLTEGEGQDTAGSDQAPAGSTGSGVDRGRSSDRRRAASGSSSSRRGGTTDQTEPWDLGRAIMAAGDLALKMTAQFPATLLCSDAAAAGRSASATAAAAGQLCVLLELMCRAEMSVTQHYSAIKAAAPSRGSSSSTAQPHYLDADRLYNVSNNLITWNLVTAFTDDPNINVGPLVHPIIAHSSPGSKPVKQLCSLLSTLLKVARHVSSKKPTPVLQLTDSQFGSMLFGRDHSKTYDVLLREIARVIKVTCAVAESCTARQVASAAGSSSSSSDAASPADVSGMMVLLVLLGRCCLQLGALTTAVSPTGCTLEAAMRYYLDSAVRASTGWLSACSNAAQLGALGYDAETVLECLRKAAAVSDTVRSDRHASMSARQAAVSQLQEQLLAVGRALTSFAHPSACNNPACMSFSGPSEASLVQGNSCA